MRTSYLYYVSCNITPIKSFLCNLSLTSHIAKHVWFKILPKRWGSRQALPQSPASVPVRIWAEKREGEEGGNSKYYRRIIQISSELDMSFCRIQDNKWRDYTRKDSKSMAKLQILCSESYLSCWGGGEAMTTLTTATLQPPSYYRTVY